MPFVDMWTTAPGSLPSDLFFDLQRSIYAAPRHSLCDSILTTHHWIDRHSLIPSCNPLISNIWAHILASKPYVPSSSNPCINFKVLHKEPVMSMSSRALLTIYWPRSGIFQEHHTDIKPITIVRADTEPRKNFSEYLTGMLDTIYIPGW